MGQYYTATLQKDNTFSFLDPGNYSNGRKLMEHSYFNNYFINTVLNELLNNPQKLTWVGDYAEIKDLPSNEEIINAQKNQELKIIPKIIKNDKNFNFVFNHTKKEYIDLKNYKEQAILKIKSKIKNNDDLKFYLSCLVHPVPLLTAIGNGRGGGDYYKEYSDYNMVGYWAGDLIEILEENEYDNFKELNVFFCEC